MSDEFNNLLVTDITNVSEHAKKGSEDIRLMEDRLKTFMDDMKVREKMIKDKCEEVKRIADEHAKKLLNGISAETVKFQQNCAKLTNDVKGHLKVLNSYTNYGNELKTKGTNVDIARASLDLHNRAEELLKLDVAPCYAQLKDVTVKFSPVNAVEILGGKSQNIIGNIEVKETKYSRAKIVIPKGGQVGGLTALGDELFVARVKSENVDVYNVQTYAPVRTIKVAGCCPCDMASLKPSTLFISDYMACVVYVVDVTAGMTATLGKWPTVDKPDGVSVCPAGGSTFTLLVTCRDTRKLREFDSKGTQIREISMQGDGKSVEKFRHSWYLNVSNAYLVCHGYDSAYAFILMDPAGKVLQKFDMNTILSTGGSKKTHSPNHIAVDSKDNVYTGDIFSSRIVRLDSTRKVATELVSSDAGINCPFRLHLDESRGILYVGERAEIGRVWAMKIV